MPIPTTRVELIEQVSGAFAKLQEVLQRAGPAAALRVCVDDWRVKDVVAVRAWWTHAVIDWVEAGKRGESPSLPASGYRWNETPRLNDDIVAGAAESPYDSVCDRLEEGFERALECIDSLTDAELLDVGVFPWAGKWPVSRWISINTARQYTTASRFVRTTSPR